MQVISASSRGNRANQVESAVFRGAVALVDAQGALEPLPLAVGPVLPLAALEFIAAAITESLSVCAARQGAPGNAAVENEVALSPLADIELAPAFVRSRRMEDPAAAPCKPAEQIAAAAALCASQATELVALCGGGSDALARLHALAPLTSHRVDRVALEQSRGDLHIEVKPDWALRRAAHLGVFALVLAWYAVFVSALGFGGSLEEETPNAAGGVVVVGVASAMALMIGGVWLLGTPWVTEICVGAREWRMRQRIRASLWMPLLRVFSYTRKGKTSALLGCEVRRCACACAAEVPFMR